MRFSGDLCAAARRLAPQWTAAMLAGVALAALVPVAASAGEALVERDAEARRVQQVVDDLRERLALTHHVTVAIVAHNPLLVSVKPVGEGRRAFELSVDAAFLPDLTDEDVRAIMAHELGHVWIFTNHPYLQTESQANRIAMRVVSRESLEQVYRKLADRGRAKGTLARFSDTPGRPEQ